MRKIIFFGFLFLSVNFYAQNEYLDFVIVNKDTIYGKFNTISKFISTDKKVYKLRKINTIRLNDVLYAKELITINSVFKKEHSLDNYVVNSVGYFGEVFCLNLYKQAGYGGLANIIVQTMVSSKEKFFVNKEKRLKDYIIKNKDTIYGNISKNKGTKPFLIDANDNKYKINEQDVKSYRYNNLVYTKIHYLKKNKKEKTIFLSKQLDGKIKLFVDRVEVNQAGRSVQLQSGEEQKYLMVNNDLHLITQERFLKKMFFLFKEDKAFSKRIRAREFNYANLYLFVKEYNAKH